MDIKGLITNQGLTPKFLKEKFSLVKDYNGNPALRIYKMSGNPKIGLHIAPAELVHSPNRLLISDAGDIRTL